MYCIVYKTLYYFFLKQALNLVDNPAWYKLKHESFFFNFSKENNYSSMNIFTILTKNQWNYFIVSTNLYFAAINHFVILMYRVIPIIIIIFWFFVDTLFFLLILWTLINFKTNILFLIMNIQKNPISNYFKYSKF